MATLFVTYHTCDIVGCESPRMDEDQAQSLMVAIWKPGGRTRKFAYKVHMCDGHAAQWAEQMEVFAAVGERVER